MPDHIEETMTSRGGVKVNLAHAIQAADKKHEERKRRVSRFMKVSAVIQTDLTQFEAGDTVTGNIYIKCDQISNTRSKLIRPLMEGKHLEIEVSGKEKVSWVETVFEPKEKADLEEMKGGSINSKTVQSNHRLVQKELKHKATQKIIHHKQNCFTFSNKQSELSERGTAASNRQRVTSRERGAEVDCDELTYIVPFKFSLPNGCPASVYYYNRTHPKRPKAKIKYWIKASIIDSQDGDEIIIAKSKVGLIVAEDPPTFEFLMMQMCE